MHALLAAALVSNTILAAAPAAVPAPAAPAAAARAGEVTRNPNGTLTVKDAALGFKLVLPKGAQENPAGVAGDIVYAFTLGEQPKAITVAIQRMHGRIGKLKPGEKLPLPPHVTLVPAQWRSFDVLATRLEQQAQDQVFLDFGAQIPLKGEAIIFHVAGSKAIEAELRKTLSDLLEVLGGETNWK